MDTKEITQSFGMFIREGRMKKNLLQKQVAAMLNISQVYYSYIENGSRNVDFPLALEICRVLELDLNDFTNSLRK